ncbi:MAG TPA: 1-deoxy-D-xylulose-5-phosphate reductoisomerase [Terriglobia bacterium]|nr:1-deoxy-D-xylulose-5-phosphate reductoisomerase [Terriglobia bacterium]
MKSLCILGATGSVGTNVLRVVAGLRHRFRVAAVAAGRNLDLLARQIVEFTPELAVVGCGEGVAALRGRLQALDYGRPLEILSGPEGQVAAATHPAVDFVVSASHGVTGLVATFEAIRAGKHIGLANKETLVAAGELVMQAARQHGAEILPIDSEHSALHQCLRSGAPGEIRRVILTASGGPFLRWPKRDLAAASPEQALKHPVWSMGGRITVDSATLMNKAFEVIEAHWLFGLSGGQIEVLIHPESTVHSMVEFLDGSLLAQLAVPDMRIPIQYALTYPDRLPADGGGLTLNLASLKTLRFEPPDLRRFPCLHLGRTALEGGGAATCALNAADEIAVEAFLGRRLRFTDIAQVVANVLHQTPAVRLGSIEDVLACDGEARERARAEVGRLA